LQFLDYVIFGRESRNAIMNGKTLPKGPNNIEKALQLPWIADVEDDFVDVDQWFSTILRLRHLLTPNFCLRHTTFLNKTEKQNR
jgi:hypothetical protein